jgi:hypothetical protein
MNRLLKLAELCKLAVNKENERLRSEFSEKFTEENIGKANSFADQWYRAFYQTSLYEQWKFLEDLNDVLSFIRENKDSVERAERKEEASVLAQLIELFPEQKEDLQKLNDAFLSWVKSRYINPPQGLMEHPIGDAMPTLLNYQEALPGLRQKFNENQTYRELFEAEIPEANHPGDLKNLSSDQMELAKNLADRNRGLHTIVPSNYKPKIFLGQFGPWKLWLPETELDSIAIAKVDPVTQKPHTSWCTAKNSGENFFTSYNNVNNMLFYVIKDGASPEVVEDYQSILVTKNKIAYGGNNRGTINASQKGMYEADHKRIFADQFEPIYSKIKEVTKSLNGMHPYYHKLFEVSNEILDSLGPAVKNDWNVQSFIKEKKITNLLKWIISEIKDPKKLDNLSNSKYPEIRVAVAENTHTPEDALKRLSVDKKTEVKIAIIENYKTPRAMLEKLRHDKSYLVRAAIARKFFLSADILAELSKDESEEVRAAVARNLNTPAEALNALSLDRSIKVKENIAINPSTPKVILEKIFNDFKELFDDNSISIKKNIALNISAPQNVLEELFNHNNYLIQLAVAGNPNTPAYILKILSKDKYEKIKIAVAGNSNAPTDVLEELSESESEDIKAAIADNANAPIYVLEKLLDDDSSWVRNNVMFNRTYKAYMRQKRALENGSMQKKLSSLSFILKEQNLEKESAELLIILKRLKNEKKI